MKKLYLLSALSMLCFLFGCSHHLEINNLHKYQSSFLNSTPKDLTIGVSTSASDKDGRVLVTGMAAGLAKNSYSVVYPYSPADKNKVDIITDVKVHPKHTGSYLNFFINFPGFLVWAPAINGYQYYPAYDIDIDLISVANNNKIETVNIPIKLDVNHADIGRTWTEISWFECGVIALISGVVFTSYDDDITPLVESEIKGPVGDYLAQMVIEKLSRPGIIEKIRQKESPPAIESKESGL